jgi:hypothetical protein
MRINSDTEEELKRNKSGLSAIFSGLAQVTAPRYGTSWANTVIKRKSIYD